jgi:hypothetical protein
MRPIHLLPDYDGGSLVNLMASIVAARGGRPRHAPLRDLELGDARNMVLFIIDGLGDNYLARRGAGGELSRRRRRAMTSVFPSTTASAITTSYTGCTPLEHGLTGWFTYFGEAGYVGSPLPFRSRGDNIPLSAKGFSAERAFTAPSLFEQMPVRSIVVTYQDIVGSEYNRRHCRGAETRAYGTIEELIAQVEAAVKSGDERKFIYAYWPHYDATSHPYGSQSAEAFREFERVDSAFGMLLARLAGTDTLVLATADHGFMDSPHEDALVLPERLAAQLRFPLCGERRVVYCHVHEPGRFMRDAADWLGERAEVRRSGELVDEGWFGPGTPHARFPERVGDVTLVLRGRHTLKDWIAGEPRHLHIGNHGGTSEDEMLIPLIVEET